MNFETLINGLKVFLIASTPVIELRGAIPFGIGVLNMPPWESFLWAFLGNMAPIFFLLKILKPCTEFIFTHSHFLRSHLEKHFYKLHAKHSPSFNKWGALFLALFVAVPIPGTGAWTGALLAYIFNIPYFLALGSIGLGVLGAGIIVLGISVAIV